MTKEEAIERIKYLLFIYKKDDEKGYRATGEVFNTDFEAIETVLNMLKEKDTEIEKKDKMIDLRNKELIIKEDELKFSDEERIKLNKMIDLMAEYISDLDIDEDICKKQSDNNCDDINREVECKECIKQYFEKQAKEKGE